MRGRSPRTREGRIGPTAQNCSGQWSVAALILAETRMGTDHGLGGSRGIREFAAINWDAPLIIRWIDRDSARCYTDSIPSLHSNEF